MYASLPPSLCHHRMALTLFSPLFLPLFLPPSLPPCLPTYMYPPLSLHVPTTHYHFPLHVDQVAGLDRDLEAQDWEVVLQSCTILDGNWGGKECINSAVLFQSCVDPVSSSREALCLVNEGSADGLFVTGTFGSSTYHYHQLAIRYKGGNESSVGEDPLNHQGGISVMMRDLQVSDKEKAWSSHYYTFSSQQLVKYELYFKHKTTSRDLPQRPEDYLFKLLSHISNTKEIETGGREVVAQGGTFESCEYFLLPIWFYLASAPTSYMHWRTNNIAPFPFFLSF